jgi:hypothetical protein
VEIISLYHTAGKGHRGEFREGSALAMKRTIRGPEAVIQKIGKNAIASRQELEKETARLIGTWRLLSFPNVAGAESRCQMTSRLLPDC